MKTRKTFQLLLVALFSVSFLFASSMNAQDKELERPKNMGDSKFDNFKNSSFDIYDKVGEIDQNLGKIEENLLSYQEDKDNMDLTSLKNDIKALKELNKDIPKLKSELTELSGQGKTLATEASTNNNLNIYINTQSGVNLNGVSDVVTPDIDASNGVIHVVDGVIGLPSVVDLALADDTFSILVSAFQFQCAFSPSRGSGHPASPTSGPAGQLASRPTDQPAN